MPKRNVADLADWKFDRVNKKLDIEPSAGVLIIRGNFDITLFYPQ